MIIGVGTDLVEVKRVAELLERHGERARSKLFTAAELARCEASARPSESLAGRFAAKEAFFKALGTGWGRGGAWHEVEVVSSPHGAPSLRLSGTAGRLAGERGVRAIHLSVTHTAELAAAYVVLEG